MHPQSGNADGTFLLMVEQESAPPPLATMQDPPLATMQDDGCIAPNDSTVQQPPPPAQPKERQEEVEQFADPDGDEGEDLLFDGNNNVFIGLDNYQDGQNEHCQKWNSYILEKDALLGVTMTKGQEGVKCITWKVRGDVSDANLPPDINAEYWEVGVRGFDFTANNTQSYKDAPNVQISCHSSSTSGQVTGVCKSNMNDITDRKNDENSVKICKIGHNQQARVRAGIRHISEKEFWIFWGIILAGHVHRRFGELWDNAGQKGKGIKLTTASS